MPELVELIAPQGKIKTSVDLPVSKSMCNRALVLQAATAGRIKPDILSEADDTRLLNEALAQKSEHIYVGAGGTTLRFLLPVLAATPGYSGLVKGSERLMQRPLSGLIEAINTIGGHVERTTEGIRIEGKQVKGGTLKLPPSETSQFATALLLASPLFEQGIELDTGPNLASATYFEMTLKMMQRAGFTMERVGSKVSIKPQMPESQVLEMEKDWSAASYWFGISALRPGSEILLKGLKKESVQGDSLCSAIFGLLGVQSHETEAGLVISSGESRDFTLGIDVSDVPDLFQTLAFTLAGLGKKYSFSGLSTLRVKETDRIAAVCSQLNKVRVQSRFLADDVLFFDASDLKTDGTIIFESFDDHRMAMSAAVISTVMWRAAVRDPYVVSKSYPTFWKDLAGAGFAVRELES